MALRKRLPPELKGPASTLASASPEAIGGHGIKFRQRHAFALTHAKYRVSDPSLFLDVVLHSRLFRKTERDDKNPDEWMEMAIVRRADSKPEDRDDFIANFVIEGDGEELTGFDLYARSKERMEEARRMLEVMLPGAIHLVKVGPYDGSWPAGWRNVPKDE